MRLWTRNRTAVSSGAERGAHVDGDRTGEGVFVFGGVTAHLAGEGGGAGVTGTSVPTSTTRPGSTSVSST